MAEEFRELACKLTDEEREQRIGLQQQLIDEIDEVTEEKKAISSRHSSRLKELNAKLRVIKRAVQQRLEVRQVRCIEREVFANNTILVVRTDTGETVDTRAMNLLERKGQPPTAKKNGKPADDEKLKAEEKKADALLAAASKSAEPTSGSYVLFVKPADWQRVPIANKSMFHSRIEKNGATSDITAEGELRISALDVESDPFKRIHELAKELGIVFGLEETAVEPGTAPAPKKRRAKKDDAAAE